MTFTNSYRSKSEIAEKMLKLVKARSHPLKFKLMQLLLIYGELSTSELVNKTGKSKPTVLKHLEELEALEEVSYRTETSPGAYDRRIYSSTITKWTIQGRNLRDSARRNPEIAIEYMKFQLSQLLIIKDIVDCMVEYQGRLNIEVMKAVEKRNAEEIIDLYKDNLGLVQQHYLSKAQFLGEGPETPKEYLRLELLLPIRRVIEQLAKDEWEKDGSLWE